MQAFSDRFGRVLPALNDPQQYKTAVTDAGNALKDVQAALFGAELNVWPSSTDDASRDRFVLCPLVAGICDASGVEDRELAELRVEVALRQDGLSEAERRADQRRRVGEHAEEVYARLR